MFNWFLLYKFIRTCYVQLRCKKKCDWLSVTYFVCDCLKAYVSNWSIMMKICETHRQVIDSVVHQKVTNVSLKRSAEDLLSRLEPIAEALDSVEGDGSSVSDAVAAWKQLQLLTEFHQIWHIVNA